MDRSILERLLLGDGVKKICKELRVGKARVREVRRKAVDARYLTLDGHSPGEVSLPVVPAALFPDFVDGRSLRSSHADQLLKEIDGQIREQLQSGWSPITVFEELPFEVGAVSRSSFYRYLKRNKLHRLNEEGEGGLVGPIVHAPGEALILDWGKLRDVVDPKTGKKHTLWAFVGVMGASRYMMVRLVWSNSVAETLAAIEHFFLELGGVPSRLTSDNPKCFALKADQYDPFLNPALEYFAAHYQFRMECLPPRDPKKKGKVERMMPYVRRLFEAYPDEFVGLTHAQEYMDKKCKLANERKHGTTRLKPIDELLDHEVKALKNLPAVAFEPVSVSYPKVRRDNYIRFDNKYYAVADSCNGKDATVLATATRISIFVGGKLEETYNRITDPHQTHATHEHLKKSWQKIEENHAHFVTRADAIGPECGRLVRKILGQGDGFVDIRIVWGILALDKKYNEAAIERACLLAQQAHKLSSRYIESLLSIDPSAKNTPKPLPTPEPVTSVTVQSNFKFARSMSDYIGRIREQAQPGLAVQLNQQQLQQANLS